jgi:calcineurin-like phosphoesterase family protein
LGNRFYIADLHFKHRRMVKKDEVTGESLRPWDTLEEMDEALIANWNATVNPKDKVYVLGDFCLNRSALATAGRLNGDKTLVGGNHDTMRIQEYLEHFKEVKGCVDLSKERWILTHIPVHTGQLERWKANIHGHLHTHTVDDPRYLCVSVEQTDYRPLSHEEVAARLAAQQEA